MSDQSTIQKHLLNLIREGDRKRSHYYRRLSWVGTEHDGKVVLGLPNEIMVRSFRRHLASELLRELGTEFDISDLKIVVDASGVSMISDEQLQEVADLPQTPSRPEIAVSGGFSQAKSLPLNERMTFDRFVSGDINRVALAASQQVANEPGGRINPLFLYGGVGLGKTHLMHAIGNACVRRDRNFDIVYVTSEQFLNDYVRSLSSKRMSEFRARYRRCDLLMIDDVQFLEEWDKTQDELFNIYNQLQPAGAQMVFTSDRPPSALSRMTDRLLSRLSSGLVLELKPPDERLTHELCRHVLREEGAEIPDRILRYIALNIQGSVRTIYSVIRKLAFFSLYEDANAWTEVRVLDIVCDIVPPKPSISRPTAEPLTAERIVAFVSAKTGAPHEDIAKGGRTRQVVRARQICMYFCRKFTDMSLAELGRFFGGKNHTTVMKAVQRLEQLLREEQDLAEFVSDLEGELKAL